MDSDEKNRKTKITYEAIEELPPNLVGEIVEDTLYASPRPAAPHALAASALMVAVGGPFHFDLEGPGGWWILVEPELHLGPDVIVPDLAGWRRERMPNLPDVVHFTDPPDWICEVISPRTAALDRIHKLPAYARAGVAHAWMVDPREHSLEVFRLAEDQWVFIQCWDGDQRVRAEPFEAVELDLSKLWLPKA
ncbi:hypothetical protein AKJ08_1179 [Vulgatibacter incomptus]|uniref:Putative restriction endonuclease domain-containing protein n=2 Tax=Vulgatibacter incomptus TaxID=1391653 RepID=A0A0K1PBC1_9BACT|nr:hypothetical protein AKJ08_1179 [Vulgatibacter incomptus]